MSGTISFKSSGSFNNIKSFLKRNREQEIRKVLDYYGQMGVEALSAATPVKTGKTAGSWYYEISIKSVGKGYSVELSWHNSNRTEDGIPIVILLRYGHATGGGGYVQGYDFITPAIAPIFDEIKESVWTEVTRE